MSSFAHAEKKRWSPTQEQVRRLENLYNTGIHNPTTDQIHLITAHLQQYGKIGGMNVFYWFKNHKARESRRKKQCIHIQPRPRTAKEEASSSSSSSFSPQTNVVLFGLEVTSMIAESTAKEKEVAVMINGQQSLCMPEVNEYTSPYLLMGSNIGHGVEKEPLQTLQLFPVYNHHE